MPIAQNRKAFHNYFIEEKYEAGLVLLGWEVKAIREGRVQIKEAYVRRLKDAFYLIGCHITALPTASTHLIAEPLRNRKLLLHRREINQLIGKVERAGYTLIPLDLHFREGKIKLEFGMAKGKKQHDKRDAAREKDIKREIQRVLKKTA